MRAEDETRLIRGKAVHEAGATGLTAEGVSLVEGGQDELCALRNAKAYGVA